MTTEVGLPTVDPQLPEDVAEAEVLKCIHTLNDDPRVHTIFIQLSLPSRSNGHRILSSVKERKHVAGLGAETNGNPALRGEHAFSRGGQHASGPR